MIREFIEYRAEKTDENSYDIVGYDKKTSDMDLDEGLRGRCGQEGEFRQEDVLGLKMPYQNVNNLFIQCYKQNMAGEEHSLLEEAQNKLYALQRQLVDLI